MTGYAKGNTPSQHCTQSWRHECMIAIDERFDAMCSLAQGHLDILRSTGYGQHQVVAVHLQNYADSRHDHGFSESEEVSEI